MNRSVKIFRIIAIAEGVSFLVLLFVAMPLKYFGDMPGAVKYTGWIHGVLFIAYVPGLLAAARSLKWGLQMTFIGFVASLLPGGAFFFERKIGEGIPRQHP